MFWTWWSLGCDHAPQTKPNRGARRQTPRVAGSAASECWASLSAMACESPHVVCRQVESRLPLCAADEAQSQSLAFSGLVESRLPLRPADEAQPRRVPTSLSAMTCKSSHVVCQVESRLLLRTADEAQPQSGSTFSSKAVGCRLLAPNIAPRVCVMRLICESKS